MDETYSHLLIGYLQGTLTSAEEQQLRMLIKDGRIDPNELKELGETWKDLSLPKVPELPPGSKLHGRFYAMLEEEKNMTYGKVTNIASVWIRRLQAGFERHKAVYAATFFLAGILIGNLFTPFGSSHQNIDRLTAEVYHMREIMMMSLLENNSPAERLRAVNISSEIPESSGRVAEALLQTLNRDPNVNVRIAAVDALIHHASNPAVRSAMVKSITRQESPLVQIALADAMIVLQETEAVDQFKKLLEQDDMDTNVRNKIESTILVLN